MNCPHIPELRYGEFSKRLHQMVHDRRIPISGTFEVTMRCNVRCKHCYLAHGHTGIPGEEELSLKEIQRIIDEIVDAGCLWLLLTGGEPLMRRDFLDIYDYAKQKGLLVTVFTNGTMLTERVVDHLAEWQPFNIEITLYGHTQETYERVTGIPGSHAHCRRGIELLLERGLPLKLKTVLMTLNQHELNDMRQYADSLGIEFRFDPCVGPAIEDHAAPLPLRLAPEDIIVYEREDPIKLANWPIQFEKAPDMQYDAGKLYLCGAGLNSFHIDPYGQLSPCITERHCSYNLRRGSFIEGWNEHIGPFVSQNHTDRYECQGCKIRTTCAQCPAMARMELGDPEKRIPFYCQLSHLRVSTFSNLTDDVLIPIYNKHEVSISN